LIVVVLVPLTESVKRVLVTLTSRVAARAADERKAAARSTRQAALRRNDPGIAVSIGVSFCGTTTVRD
jgi:hypothetical protein